MNSNNMLPDGTEVPWRKVLELMDEIEIKGGTARLICRPNFIAESLGVSIHTALTYWQWLMDTDEWVSTFLQENT